MLYVLLESIVLYQPLGEIEKTLFYQKLSEISLMKKDWKTINTEPSVRNCFKDLPLLVWPACTDLEYGGTETVGELTGAV